MKREEPFVAYKVLPRTRISTGTPREKMEQLLNIALVSPFFPYSYNLHRRNCLCARCEKRDRTGN
jgi:hypothetical protein